MPQSKSVGKKLRTAQIKVLKQSDIGKCKFFIFDPSHYREDGSCKCNDAAHRRMMIEQWEYSSSDFEGIPLRR